MSEVTLTQADHGKTIEVVPGDRIVIRLAENPATGYRWAVEEAPEDALALEHADFSRAADAAVGGGGMKKLTFQAQKPGTSPIRLKLWRDWEGDASITTRYAVTVQVLGGSS